MKYSSPYEKINTNNALYLATNENPNPLPSNIQEILTKKLNFTNRYPKVNPQDLIKKIAGKHRVDPDNIILGSGSDEILMFISLMYIQKNCNTIMSNPSFFRYKQLTELLGGICKLTDNKDFKHDLDKMYQAIDSKTKIIFICNPNNPTGTLILKDELETFLNKVPKDILITMDEAYFDYVDKNISTTSINLINKYKNLVVLRTFSKFYALAGLRIGYAIADQRIISTLYKSKSPYNNNSISQEAASLILDCPQFELDTYTANLKGRDLYYDLFDKYNISYIKTQSNFIFVNFENNCQTICSTLEDNGIFVRNCALFGYPTYIRITIGNHNENEKLILLLDKIIGGIKK